MRCGRPPARLRPHPVHARAVRRAHGRRLAWSSSRCCARALSPD